MAKQIRKAVFPVAGLGTRFLPATKANPKEMLPVVDKPLIQYAVEEAVQAGAEVLIFVTGRTKRAIEDHFDRAYELETELQLRKQEEKLRQVQNIVPEGVVCVHIRQAEALGLGHAVLCAEPVVGGEPFFVVLADDLIANGGRSCLSQMRNAYQEFGCSLIGVQKIPNEDSDKYGVVKGHQAGERLLQVEHIVEKPHPKDAPSDLGVVGRYILTPRIFELLKKTGAGAGGEIQLTDAIASMLRFEHVYAYAFSGKRYDCGSKLGYLEATVELGLQHPELGDNFKSYLQELIAGFSNDNDKRRSSG
ncbi:MAG: UTP--glucose-1-phosphate uridylyltransferase GalU [Gammaproteobacteria bacterium]|nr:UTP--glucose-1-phosphate uridylyltransferase GalU [Gammaproteobacteria bacterium]